MRPLIIGVAGGTGSGKTTVANKILERVGTEHIAYIPHDAYYINLGHLPAAERAKTNFDHPDALETSLLVEHVKRLREGKAVNIPVYDFTTHTRTAQTRHIDPAPIVLVEGIL
ncbi:MAG: uridine kinase, partial [Anaerolineae bacterium]|nr:uridine kinase [Anaerolineae bacterium]